MEGCVGKRRTFRWSREARDLVRSNLQVSGSDLRRLVTDLSQMTGYPRDACLRFARSMGVKAKKSYRKWSERETKRLFELLENHSIRTVATELRRSRKSIERRQARLGVSSAMYKDSFTKYTLAELLHIRRRAVQKWIDDGLLKARVEGTLRLPRLIIEAADFVCFCHEHPEAVHEGRVRPDRLEFVFKFVFPRSHVDLLPVREAKKERAAYQEQMRAEDGDEFSPEGEFTDWEDDGYPLQRTA